MSFSEVKARDRATIAASSGVSLDLSGGSLVDTPFRYATYTDCMSRSDTEEVLGWFETSAPWQHTETDFYEQYEFSCWDSDDSVGVRLTDGRALDELRHGMSDLFGVRLNPNVSVVAHKLVPGHRIGLHNDYLVGEETHRFVVQLNRGLSDADGGFFMLFNSSDASDIHQILRPANMSGFAFEISPSSYHAISQLHSNVRYSLVYSFFQAP